VITVTDLKVFVNIGGTAWYYWHSARDGIVVEKVAILLADDE